ncbi:phosphotransferase [Photobacterium sp. ZSDE20]|uniref:Phosphotransferase n=1 Tax=Photobacterium pectinilyticum TaxID=2906793 RepID=A0ABT1N3K8_9GAMM|nr:phosphotransferase [Photobacterium sp. ZSDE20]MCQ1059132.1 phosphotransferase [Photobacterium sp. ZSDE20]MDD1824363.1 phosphotransferase [Photobacterium sp. ZSDE20]
MNRLQLKRIAELSFKTMFRETPQVFEIQETFYGCVVFLASGNSKVVVKFSHEIGRLRKEIEGLERLRQALPCPVPEVLFFGREEGYDFIMLEWLEGISAHQIPNEKDAVQRFAESYLELLHTLHSISEPNGFELESGRFDPSLSKAFSHWMEPVYRYVASAASPFTPVQKQKYHSLWQMRDNILSEALPESSLIHDDCHVGNILVDPKSFEVTAILDPCDVGFKHREMDLFHLLDVRPEMQLAERYKQEMPLAPGFELRRWYFSLWDDAKHSRNIGWYDEAWIQNKLSQFDQTLSVEYGYVL